MTTYQQQLNLAGYFWRSRCWVNTTLFFHTGAKVQQSPSCFFSLLFHHAQPQSHLLKSRDTVTAWLHGREPPAQSPSLGASGRPLLSDSGRAAPMLLLEGPGAAVRSLPGGRSFRVHGWCASLSFLLCPEQYKGSGCRRGSGGFANPRKPGLGEERCGRDLGQAPGAMVQPGAAHPQR